MCPRRELDTETDWLDLQLQSDLDFDTCVIKAVAMRTRIVPETLVDSDELTAASTIRLH